MVAQLLELAQLVDQNRMTQVQIRGGGIKARLDSQRAAAGDALAQFVFLNDLIRATAQQRQLFVHLDHHHLIHGPGMAGPSLF